MAAVDKTEIANLALSHLHDKGLIENVDTEESTQAKTAKAWYNPARRQALAEMDMGFARKRLALATHGEDAPEDEWAFRYQYPADCIQPRYIKNPLGRKKPPIPFEIEQADDGTMSIVTGVENAVLVYTRDAEDPTFFTPHFVLALSYLLAHYMAGPLSGKPSLKDKALANYILAIGTGGALEANVTAKGTDEQPLASWHQER